MPLTNKNTRFARLRADLRRWWWRIVGGGARSPAPPAAGAPADPAAKDDGARLPPPAPVAGRAPEPVEAAPETDPVAGDSLPSGILEPHGPADSPAAAMWRALEDFADRNASPPFLDRLPEEVLTEPAPGEAIVDAGPAGSDTDECNAGAQASPPPPAAGPRAGRWRRDAVVAANGTIDLAPWVLPRRLYRVYQPARLAADPAIVVMLHGCRQKTEEVAEGTRLNEHADERGWLVVYPEQTKAANRHRCWNWFDPANHRGDGECALIVAALAAVRKRWALPHAPAFLAGMSAGGALANLLALRYPELWSGVAIHSGLPFGAAADPWGAIRAMREGPVNLDAAQSVRTATSAAGAIPALVLHGAADTIVDRRNAELVVRQFLGWNGSFDPGSSWMDAPLPSVESVHAKTEEGHDYILREYRSAPNVNVRECEVVQMGHAWTGGDSAVPFHDELGPDGTGLMMGFFADIANRAGRDAVTLH